MVLKRLCIERESEGELALTQDGVHQFSQYSCYYYCNNTCPYHQRGTSVSNTDACRRQFITTRCSIHSSTNVAALCWSRSSDLFKHRRCFSRWEMKHFLARTLTTLWPTLMHPCRGVSVVNAIYYLSHCYSIAWDRLSNQFFCLCMYVCMYVCVCGHSYGRIFQPIFTKFGKNLWGLNQKN